MRPTLSIIVPVYNGAAHLERCLASIEQQAHMATGTIELIIIDDGSTDRSPDIIAEFAATSQTRLVTVRQQNRGAATARNRGLTRASGDYMMYVDQDDWIDATYCATLLDAAIRHDADVVQGGYRRPKSADDRARDVMPVPTMYGRYMANAAWAKLYRTKFLRDYDVTFWDNPVGEDTLFTIRLLRHAPKWATVRNGGYHWVRNPQSVSETHQTVLTPQLQTSLDALVTRLCEEGDGSPAHTYFVVRMIVFYLLRGVRSLSSSEFARFGQQLFERATSGYPEMLAWRRLLLPPRGEKLSVGVVVFCVAAMYRFGLLRVVAQLYRLLPANK